MRFGILSDPLLFQCGLAVRLQVRQTLHAMAALRYFNSQPVSVTLLGPDPEQLDAFDLIHIFSCAGAHRAVIEAAHSHRVPVIVTPLHNERQSSHNRETLGLASMVLALDEQDGDGAPREPAAASVLPCGLHQRQFLADGALFRQRTGLRTPFVLMEGAIAPCHDQLGMARALGDAGVALVTLGDPVAGSADYLGQLARQPGAHCIGDMRHDADMLASARAAASVLVLHGAGAGRSGTALAALAAGTPVVLDAPAALPVAEGGCALRLVEGAALCRQQAVLDLLARPPAREQVRALVRACSWERVARQLAASYVSLVRCERVLAA